MHQIIEMIMSAVILFMATLHGLHYEHDRHEEKQPPKDEPEQNDPFENARYLPPCEVYPYCMDENTSEPDDTLEEAIEKSSESTACPYDPKSMTWMEYSNACMTRLGYCPRNPQTREYIKDGKCIIPPTIEVRAF